MGAVHIIPGIDDPTCGIAVAAKQLIARGIGDNGEVWVHSMWSPMVIKASIKAVLTGKKLVRMPHGCTDPAKLQFHWHKKCWVAPIERWLFRRADRIVATCEGEVEWIKAFEPKVKKVEIVPLSLQPSAYTSYLKSPSLSELDQPATLKLLYIGRLHSLKGIEFLLEAMHLLQGANDTTSLIPPLHLKIIGKDEGEGKKLRCMTADYNLNVEFCGVVGEDEKEAAYQWCDVLVLPSLSENFGLVVAEALERGKRVITTDGAPAWGDGNDYGGRLIYLKGYRGGSPEERVRLLKCAIASFASSLTSN